MMLMVFQWRNQNKKEAFMEKHKPLARLLYLGLESSEHAAECRKEYKELLEKAAKYDEEKETQISSINPTGI